MAGNVRQHYSMATGGGLERAAHGPSGPRPKYAKGGRVRNDHDADDRYAKGGMVQIKNDYLGRAPGDKKDKSREFGPGKIGKYSRGGMVHEAKHIAKGFKRFGS